MMRSSANADDRLLSWRIARPSDRLCRPPASRRQALPDNDDAEIIELSRTLNSLFGEQAKDAALFRNPNGVYMKLANF
jgi:hypothetical protein